jgi:hypothetical protein
LRVGRLFLRRHDQWWQLEGRRWLPGLRVARLRPGIRRQEKRRRNDNGNDSERHVRLTTKVNHPVNYAQRERSVAQDSPWLAHEPVLG